MKIKKISRKNLIVNKENAIVHMFNNYSGLILKQLIPAEYDSLLKEYEKIKKERNKTKDLPGQMFLF